MKEEMKQAGRRHFLKTAATAGAGLLLSTGGLTGEGTRVDAAETAVGTVPTRPFGRSGVRVSILSLGGMFDIPSNQLLLKQALRWGVTYWDTADCYGGGRSEKGIGKFFKRYPEKRSQVFLVTKSDKRHPRGMTRLLERSLERLQTDYIDLYFLHGVRRISELTGATRAWAEEAKKAGRIRLFGFSTHSNMEACMLAAARLDWIDGIMMKYNYRLMHEPRMKAAVQACVAAGIGLTAMKTQGGGVVTAATESELRVAGHFLKKGYTGPQAKLKAVWENPHIASICSQMPNMDILMANTAAAMNTTALSAADMNLLRRLDRETASTYCAGCADICEACLAAPVPVADIMRYLMYRRNYGDAQRAAALFARLPREVHRRLTTTDYRPAEKRCPRRIPIGRLMAEAARELGDGRIRS